MVIPQKNYMNKPKYNPYNAYNANAKPVSRLNNNIGMYNKKPAVNPFLAKPVINNKNYVKPSPIVKDNISKPIVKSKNYQYNPPINNKFLKNIKPSENIGQRVGQIRK